MDRLFRIARSLLIAQGEMLVARGVTRRLSRAAEAHVPLGGESTIHMVMSMLTWREQVRLARCSTSTQAAVRALFGAPHAPAECHVDDLPNMLRSHVCHFVRHLRLVCGPEMTHATMDQLRELSYLRLLTLAQFAAPDTGLIVMLTQRPSPTIMQYVRIEQLACFDASAGEALRLLPALHTLSLHDCGLLGSDALAALPRYPTLTQLGLNLAADAETISEALMPIASANTHLRRLHLHTLGAARVAVPMMRALLAAPIAHHLERLSLGYMDLRSAPRGRSSSAPSSVSSSAPSLDFDFDGLLALTALRVLELTWVSPLSHILQHIARLPRLESLLIGDDDIRLVESAIADHLAPHASNLVMIGLFGFVGVPRAQFEQLAQAVRETTRDDQKRTHPLVVQYLGLRREAVMHHPSIFEWAR